MLGAAGVHGGLAALGLQPARLLEIRGPGLGFRV